MLLSVAEQNMIGAVLLREQRRLLDAYGAAGHPTILEYDNGRIGARDRNTGQVLDQVPPDALKASEELRAIFRLLQRLDLEIVRRELKDHPTATTDPETLIRGKVGIAQRLIGTALADAEAVQERARGFSQDRITNVIEKLQDAREMLKDVPGGEIVEGGA